MTALFSMPVPFAMALVVLMVVGAISFVQFIVLALTPGQADRSISPDRRLTRQTGRRLSDRGLANDAVLS